MTEQETTDVDLDLSDLTALIGQPVTGIMRLDDGRWVALTPSGDQWVLGEPAAISISVFGERDRVLITAKSAATAGRDRACQEVVN